MRSDAGGTPPPTATSAKPLRYLDERSLQLDAALPLPPPDRGALSRGEIDLMLAIQSEASETARERAKGDESLRAWNFADVLGSGFTKEQMPLTAALVQQAAADTGIISDRVKAKFNRVRPPAQDSRVGTLFAVPTNASYPSGHAIRAMVFARVLAMLAPDKEQRLECARLVAYDRVVAGVHFPTDVAAGLTLGGLIADQLAASPAFQADLAKARTEWPR